MSNGLQLVPEVPERPDLRKRYERALREYAKVNGKRVPDGLKMRVPARYADPGKGREIEAIIAERIADCEGEYPIEVGKSHVPGYLTRATNGHYLIAERGEGSQAARTVYPAPAPADTWPIGPDTWRAYGRVRTCRSESTQRVTWAFGDLGLVLTASEPEVCEASERIDGVYPDGRIVLDDRYLWPLRGIAWQAGLTGDRHTPMAALHLTAGPYMVLIMGIRE